MIPREVALTEVWLDDQARLADGSFPAAQTVRRYERIGQLAGLVGLAMLAIWYWRMMQ